MKLMFLQAWTTKEGFLNAYVFSSQFRTNKTRKRLDLVGDRPSEGFSVRKNKVGTETSNNLFLWDAIKILKEVK